MDGVDPVMDSGVGCARSYTPLFAIMVAAAKSARTPWSIRVAVVCDGPGIGRTLTFAITSGRPLPTARIPRISISLLARMT